MWLTMLSINLLACFVVAVPTHGDVTNNFQAAIEHQSFHTILMSIEERLRNLDSLYSMQLSPTLQDKLDQYHRKLDAIDVKIIRLESLVMLNLDKISENISTKNFKDDVSNTNLAKKIDAIYEGINHRLGYMDRKMDTQTTKTQVKLDASLTRLEQIEDGIVRRDEDIEAELSDAIAAIDDLKTGSVVMEENIRNETHENFQDILRSQKAILENHVNTNLLFKALLVNTSGSFEKMQQHLDAGLQQLNVSESFIKDMKAELKGDLNEYAIKVGEMNSENWKSGKALLEKQVLAENAINASKLEVQNGFRALMVLVGKNTNKDPADKEIDKLNDKLDSNFEKVFSAQSSFMDNCYRLQMDESQIESKISEILEKLMETFEKKTAIEIKDINNLEKLIKNHDSRINRNLHQIGHNVVNLNAKLDSNYQKVNSSLNNLWQRLGAYFSVLQNTLTDENKPSSPKNINVLLRSLGELKANVVLLDKRGKNITNTIGQMKGLIRVALDKNTTMQPINEQLSNITRILNEMETKINKNYLDHNYNTSKMEETVRKFGVQLQKFMESVNRINVTRKATDLSRFDSSDIPEISPKNPEENQRINNDDIDALIEQVFGGSRSKSQENITKTATDLSGVERSDMPKISAKNSTKNNDNIDELIQQVFGGSQENATETPSKNKKCQSYVDVIDVRSGFDENNCNEENVGQPVNKKTEGLERSTDNVQQSNGDYYEEIQGIADQIFIGDNVFGGDLNGNQGNDYGTLEITRIQ